MKLGVLNAMFGSKPLNETLSYLASLGVETIEIGCGGFPGKGQCDPEKLLADDEAFAAFKKTIDESGVAISALSCHGNMVHPDKAVADGFIADFKNAILLAEKLGVEAYGVASDYNTYSGQTSRDLREILARNKDFATSIFKPEPTYLGEVIPVSGNGDATND